MHIREYRVAGHGDFPVDMLRYDSCWPADGDSAFKLVLPLYEQTNDGQRNWLRKTRVLRLRSYSNPTDARWSSFGWMVVNEKLFAGMNADDVEAALARGAEARS